MKRNRIVSALLFCLLAACLALPAQALQNLDGYRMGELTQYRVYPDPDSELQPYLYAFPEATICLAASDGFSSADGSCDLMLMRGNVIVDPQGNITNGVPERQAVMIQAVQEVQLADLSSLPNIYCITSFEMVTPDSTFPANTSLWGGCPAYFPSEITAEEYTSVVPEGDDEEYYDEEGNAHYIDPEETAGTQCYYWTGYIDVTPLLDLPEDADLQNHLYWTVSVTAYGSQQPIYDLMRTLENYTPAVGPALVQSLIIGDEMLEALDDPGYVPVPPTTHHTPADDDPGEEGFTVPPAVIAAALGAAGGAVLLKKKKGKKPGKQKRRKPKEAERQEPPREEPAEHEPEPEKPEEEAPQSTYQLRVYKDFGDTLYPGEEVSVYARMVEITPEGYERKAPDLTRRIQIYARDYLTVHGAAMAGDYKGAFVLPPQTDTLPREASVIFDFAGIYKVEMHFKVAFEQVVFGQDNLTLPACYDQDARMPFAVFGAPEDAPIQVEVTPAGYYTATLEQGGEKNLYYALIHEVCKDTDTPGHCQECRLRVTVQNGKRTFEQRLPLYRFHMGFAVYMDSLNCYLSPTELQKGRGVAEDSNGRMILYDWDEESHTILRIAPVPTDYSVTTEDPECREMLETLAIGCRVDPEPIDGWRTFTMRCSKAVLDPPTRFKVKVRFVTEYNGRAYAWEGTKLCRSQAVRQFENDAAAVKQHQQDQHITDRLYHIQQKIRNDGLTAQLFPLAHFIDTVLEGYDPSYGYDPHQIAQIRSVFERFLNGTMVGANATPEVVTLADEIQLFIDAFWETSKEVEDSLGFFGRMAVGCATLGMSDVVFTGLNVVRDMKAYADNGGDSVLGGFMVGAKSVTMDYLSEKAMNLGMGALAAGAAKYTPGLARKAGELADGAIRTIHTKVEQVKGFFTNKLGGKAKRILKESKAFKAGLDVEADDLIVSQRRRMKWTDEDLELDRVYRQGGVDATQKLRNLRDAQMLAEAAPTPENLQFYKRQVLEVQQDKAAMRRLNELADGDKVRASFNKTLDDAYQRTNHKVRAELAEELNKANGTHLTADDIEIFNATSSSKADLLAGKRITYDQDITWTVKGRSDLAISQEMAAKVQNRCWFEESFGVRPADDNIAARWARKTDQSVVQATSLENYGSIEDLHRVLKDHDLPLLDPKRVGDTVTYKSMEWFSSGDALMKAALEETNPILKEQIMAMAMHYRQEGIRQMVKQFKYVDARNLAAMCRGRASQLTKELHLNVKLCAHLFQTGPTNLSLRELEKMLALRGVTPEQLAGLVGQAMTAIG